MIDVKELRKDNWVIGWAGEMQISTKGISLIDENPNGCSVDPIPLTEEWVKRSRFKFKKLGFNNLSISVGLIGGEIHFVIDRYYVKLEYVHQLQNLYFALCGEELEIK